MPERCDHREMFTRRAVSWLLLALISVGLMFQGAATAQTDPEKTVDLVHLEGLLDPPSIEYLTDRLEAAEDEGVHALVIQLDTPGALDVPLDDTINRILGAEIPVVVWIAPRGAEALSGGTFIAFASDLIFMADDTRIGAASTPNLNSSPVSIDDSAELLMGMAEIAGAAPAQAEQMVRDNVIVSADDALETGTADALASSLGDLLRGMDGRTVVTSSANEGPARDAILETWDETANEGLGALTVTIRFQQLNLWQRILHAVTSPETAFLLLLAGIFGLIFELYNPGIGLAGILGAGAMLLGFYGLSVLPTNWFGVLLMVVAIAFFIIDLQIAGFGIWTIAGVASMIVSGLIVFSGESGAVTVSPWAIAAAVVGSLVFFVSVMTAALRVRLRRPITGEEGIVGQVGIAKTDIAPEGMVLTKGMLWRARTMEMGIAEGDKVEVKATEGLTLLVEPYHEHEPEPEPVES